MIFPNTCKEVLDLGEVNPFGESRVGAFIVALAALYFLVSLLILYLIQQQKRNAEEGDDKAVKAVIFPIFTYVLWANAMVNIYVAFITLAFDIRTLGQQSVNGQLYAFSVMYGIQHIVTEGVAFMLMQKGVGMNAAKRSLRYGAVWGIITFICYSIEYSGDKKHVQQFFGFIWNIALLLFYGALWLTPQKRLYRRPALMLYARFWFFFRLVCIAVLILFAFPNAEDAAQCLNVFGTLFPFAILEPIVLYYTLLQDSRWWQGLDISQGSRKESDEEIRSPLQGMDLAMDSAQSLAAQLDSFGGGGLRRRVMDTTSAAISTANTNKTVRLLNFAYISLDRTKMLGSGSFSKVYMGKYRQRKCAIKLVFTLDLTREIIRRVAAEAQLLSSIRHPNIVEILGVSVLPPSVCLLLELCHYGSLADIIHGTGAVDLWQEIPDRMTLVAAAASGSTDLESGTLALTSSSPTSSGIVQSPLNHQHRNTSVSNNNSNNITQPLPTAKNHVPFIEEFMRGGPTIAIANKRHLALSWNDRLHLAIGCARGLHALHTYAHNLCHRDIKSFNFLVDEKLNAKLSDLELGTAEEYRSNNNQNNGVKIAGQTEPVGSAGRDQPVASKDSVSSAASSSLSRFSLTSKFRSESKEVSELGIGEGVLAADEFLANWAAPEVIKSGRHVQPSDIYSFGMVLWELLSGRVPFSEVRRQDDIRFQVLSGQRPVIPSIFTAFYPSGIPGIMTENAYSSHFDAYIDLIERCWAQEPHQRPEMAEVLHELQEIYEQRCYQIVKDTDAIVKAKEEVNQFLDLQQQQKQQQQLLPTNNINNSNNNNITQQSASGLSSLTRFTLFGNIHNQHQKKDRFQSELTPEETMLIVQSLQRDSLPILEHFALRNEAWVLILPPPICQVVWATVEWQELVGLSLQNIAGKSFRNLSLFAPPNITDKQSTTNVNITDNTANKMNKRKQKKSGLLSSWFGSAPTVSTRRGRFSLSKHNAHQKFLTAWYDEVAHVFQRIKDTNKTHAPFHEVMELTLPNFLEQAQASASYTMSSTSYSHQSQPSLPLHEHSDEEDSDNIEEFEPLDVRPSTDSVSFSVATRQTRHSQASQHTNFTTSTPNSNQTQRASTASYLSSNHFYPNHNPNIPHNHVGGGKRLTFSLHVYPIFDTNHPSDNNNIDTNSNAPSMTLSTSLIPNGMNITSVASRSVMTPGSMGNKQTSLSPGTGSVSTGSGSGGVLIEAVKTLDASTPKDEVKEDKEEVRVPFGLLNPSNTEEISQNIIYEEENEEEDEERDDVADDVTVTSSVYSGSKASSYKRQLPMDDEDEAEGEEEDKEEESEKSNLESSCKKANPVPENDQTQINMRDEEDKKLTEAVEATKKASKLARRQQRQLEKEARELKRQRARERTNSNTIPLPTTGHASPLPAVIANLTPMSTTEKHPKAPAGPKLTLVAILFSPLHDPDIERMKATMQLQHGNSHPSHASTNNLSNSHSAAMAAAAMSPSGMPM